MNSEFYHTKKHVSLMRQPIFIIEKVIFKNFKAVY